MAALKEAIQIAQETNDHVCLEHCLVSLFCIACVAGTRKGKGKGIKGK